MWPVYLGDCCLDVNLVLLVVNRGHRMWMRVQLVYLPDRWVGMRNQESLHLVVHWVRMVLGVCRDEFRLARKSLDVHHFLYDEFIGLSKCCTFECMVSAIACFCIFYCNFGIVNEACDLTGVATAETLPVGP